MYRLQGEPWNAPALVDSTWQGYEKRLTGALNQLVDPHVGSVDAYLWLRVMVPFVAGLFVRGPDFTKRYEGQQAIIDIARSREAEWQRDNTNASRLLAMRRILAPITASKWIVEYSTGPEPMITNELGYVNSRHAPEPSGIGWAIPLGPAAILQILPCPEGYGRKILFDAGDGDWRAFIERVTLRPGNHVSLNSSIAVGQARLCPFYHG